MMLTNLAADKLQVSSTLGVAVTGTVLGTSLVGRVLRQASVFVHGNKVQGGVQAAVDGGEVDIKGELVVHQREHLVLGSAIHKVESRADVGAVVVLGDELESQGVATGGSAIGLGVLGALERALARAVGAEVHDDVHLLPS